MKHIISIFGSYSGKNKGDLAILLSIIQNLLNYDPNIVVHLPSKDPRYIRKFLPLDGNDQTIVHKSITSYLGVRTLKILKSSDLLVFGGGGLFFDKKPGNIFYNHVINLFILTWINKFFFKKPIYIFSVGASHLNTNLMLSMTKFILNNADWITVRDEHTSRIFSELTRKGIHIHFDPVFVLSSTFKTHDDLDDSNEKIEEKQKVLFVANETLINRCMRENRINDLTNLINSLQKNFHVVLSYNNVESEKIKQLFALCENENLTLYHPGNRTPDEIIGFYRNFDFVICTPMHSAIFAYNAEVRMVTIEYNEKIKQFNKIIGNKNSVTMNELDRILWFLEHYNEIDWSKKPIIQENALENFVKLNEAIRKSNPHHE